MDETNFLLKSSGVTDVGIKKIEEFLNMMSYQESDHRNISQTTGGPGRGYYQMETGHDAGGYTILTNSYTGLPKSLTPDWMVNEKTKMALQGKRDFDATVLTEDQQSYVLMGWILHGKDEQSSAARTDFYNMLKDSNKLKQSDVRDWWIKHWNKSPEGERRDSRLKEWDHKFENYQPKDKNYYDSADVMMQQMINEDNPLRV